MTFIPVLAIKMVPQDPIEEFYLWRTGYISQIDHPGIVLVIKLDDHEAQSDPYSWQRPGDRGRTMTAAHEYIADNFDSLQTGDVVDVEVILGETTIPKVSERFPDHGA